MKLINEVIKDMERHSNLSNYEKDKKLFHIYQKSGFCLWHKSFRSYRKKYGLHQQLLQLPN